MSLPRKKSRTITVGSRVFRWHLILNKDHCANWVIITADDTKNGSELAFTFHPGPIITPRIVRRAILAGFEDGFDPDEPNSSRTLSKERADEILHYYVRELELEGAKFTWRPDPKGGLHMKIRSQTTPKGQLLATATTLEESSLRDDVASSFITAALETGWQPELKDADCFWLEEDLCRVCLAELGFSP